MSPEQKKLYMRDYMRARRATSKSGEIPGGKVSQEASDFPSEYEDTDLAVTSSWLVWAILGGLGLLVVGLIALPIVLNAKAVKVDSSEDNAPL
jgi:hypothetical protein